MRKRLSVQQKYRICFLGSTFGLIAAFYCLICMSPWASPHHNKVFFGIAEVVVVLSLPLAIGRYYYRSRLQDVDTSQVQVETLERFGKELHQQEVVKKGTLK